MSLIAPSPSWAFLDPERPLVAHALNYVAQGFRVFPLRANKRPHINAYHQEATLDPAQVRRWWQQWPDALIGHALDEDVVILDVDPKHNGDTTWKALLAEVGPVESTMRHASGRGDGGEHHWFVRPGVLDMTVLDRWAQERGTGEPKLKGGWTSGVDLLTSSHRYTVLPPSLHPDTGQPYRWTALGQPSPMLPGLVTMLTEVAPTPASAPAQPSRPVPVIARGGIPLNTPRPPFDDDGPTPADWYSDTRRWADVLVGWTLVGGDGDSDGSRWKHPNATQDHSATVRYGCLFNYSESVNLPVTAPGDVHGLTRFSVYARFNHGGDERAAASTVRTTMMPQRERARVALPVAASTGLDDAFWNSRASLHHVFTAARSKLVAPAAVLGAVLARVAAFTPPSTCLPGTIGTEQPLSLYVALYGSSGAGKSTPAACAADLLPEVPAGCVGPLALGSGEGLVEAYLEMVDEEDANGKKRKVKRQVRHGALFSLDEGQVLADLSDRKGATILPVLRTAWSGADTGQANASIETKRSLRRGTYVCGLVSLWQTKAAVVLLDDVDGGTPQRFVWFSTIDAGATMPPPRWPGVLSWAPPPAYQLGGRFAPHPLTIDAAILDEIITHRLADLTGRSTTPALDGHRRLNKLKIAGCLAVLDGRYEITTTDWALAERIMSASDGVRDWVLAERQRAVEARAEADLARHLARAAAGEDAAYAKALAAAARAVHRAVVRAAERGERAGRRDLFLAISSRARKLVTVDEAIDEAARLGWLEGTEMTGWAPGESRPA